MDGSPTPNTAASTTASATDVPLNESNHLQQQHHPSSMDQTTYMAKLKPEDPPRYAVQRRMSAGHGQSMTERRGSNDGGLQPYRIERRGSNGGAERRPSLTNMLSNYSNHNNMNNSSHNYSSINGTSRQSRRPSLSNGTPTRSSSRPRRNVHRSKSRSRSPVPPTSSTSRTPRPKSSVWTNESMTSFRVSRRSLMVDIHDHGKHHHDAATASNTDYNSGARSRSNSFLSRSTHNASNDASTSTIDEHELLMSDNYNHQSFIAAQAAAAALKRSLKRTTSTKPTSSMIRQTRSLDIMDLKHYRNSPKNAYSATFMESNNGSANSIWLDEVMDFQDQQQKKMEDEKKKKNTRMKVLAAMKMMQLSGNKNNNYDNDDSNKSNKSATINNNSATINNNSATINTLIDQNHSNSNLNHSNTNLNHSNANLNLSNSNLNSDSITDLNNGESQTTMSLEQESKALELQELIRNVQEQQQQEQEQKLLQFQAVFNSFNNNYSSNHPKNENDNDDEHDSQASFGSDDSEQQLQQQSYIEDYTAAALSSSPSTPLVLPEWKVRFSRFRVICGNFINSWPVQIVMSFLIVCNAIILGAETYDDIRANERTTAILEGLDLSILCVFTMEVTLHAIYLGLLLFRDSWLTFDFVVVILSWAFLGSPLAVFRSFRIFRVFSIVSRWESLRTLFEAIGATIPKMASIWASLFLFFYVFCVLFTTVFHDLYDDGIYEVDYFGSLQKSFFTLFQMMTLDNWSDVARQTMVYNEWSFLGFLVFIIFTAFFVINLVVAVICESLIQVSRGPPPAMSTQPSMATLSVAESSSSDGMDGLDAAAAVNTDRLEALMRQLLNNQMAMAATLQELQQDVKKLKGE